MMLCNTITYLELLLSGFPYNHKP